MKRWTYASNPTAGTTCVVTIPVAGNSRHVMEKLLVSQQNKTAAAYTSTLTIRDSSTGGTILGQLAYFTGAAAANVDSLDTNVIGIKRVSSDTALVGAMVAHWAPPNSSVVQTIIAAGYTEEEPY